MEKSKTRKEIIRLLLDQNIDEQNDDELMEILIDNPISYDIDKKEKEKLTLGEKVSDVLSEKAGSWGFIICFCLFLIGWITLNLVLENNAIDPYPFILLNLLLSCLAAIQAPIIMMSQNRQAKKDSLRNQYDYHIDLKSELILEELYKHIEELTKNQEKILRYLKEKDQK